MATAHDEGAGYDYIDNRNYFKKKCHDTNRKYHFQNHQHATNCEAEQDGFPKVGPTVNASVKTEIVVLELFPSHKNHLDINLFFFFFGSKLLQLHDVFVIAKYVDEVPCHNFRITGGNELFFSALDINK